MGSGGSGAWLKNKPVLWICVESMAVFYCTLLLLSLLHSAFSEPIDEVFAAIRGGKENYVKRILEARHAETVKVLVEEGGVPWDSKGKGKTPLQITQNSKTKAWSKEWGKRLQKGTEL